MKIFDAHGDYWYDVAEKKRAGEKNILQKYHLEKIRAGEIHGGIFILWQPVDRNFEEMLEFTEQEIKSIGDFSEIILTKEQMKNFENGDKIKIIKGIEGLQHIKSDLKWIEKLYNLGYREMSLAWNEENELATGIRGDEKRGLTEVGRRAIKLMEELGIVLDVSHLNEKSFWDVCDVATKPFIASHSNSFSICPEKRNLKDNQIKAMGEKKGVIGMNAFRGFISQVDEEKTVAKLCDHLEYISKLIGLGSVGLGFDFCDYLDNSRPQNPIDMCDISESQKMILELQKRGYTENEMKNICYGNFQKLFIDILK
ncbi:MAG: dipeptidase [Fusobacteriaceae bacterium]